MKRILLIEPDRIIAEQTRDFLAGHDYVVDMCLDAQRAISAADAYRPDIVIMEIALAAHSGIEFLYEFRSYTEWRNIPVLVFSRLPASDIGLTDKAQKDLAIAEVLYKPDTNLERLLAKVEKYLITALI